ncbi:MAG: hypothetical protein IJJ50_07450 [Lachnospiraceae bacterium]|nr:hypothetical protein [Lachnospiraceae bacterium]
MNIKIKRPFSRSISLLAVLLTIALLSSCGKKKPEQHVCHATITEISNGTMLVTPVEGSDELRSSDAFHVPLQNMPSSPEPFEGDIVEIIYEGGILETYPAGFEKIISIQIVDAAAGAGPDAGAQNGGGNSDAQDGGISEAPDNGNSGAPDNGNSNAPGGGISEQQEAGNASVSGPYGQISVNVPDTWIWKAHPVDAPADEEGLSYGLYGLTLYPALASSGRLDLFCTDSFGVCGTGLVQEEGTLAGGRAVYGTYDDHEHWDYIIFGENDPAKSSVQIVAQHTECTWSPEMWDEAIAILDSMRFDPSKAQGGVGQFIRESENDEIGVIMEMHNILPTGATVRFRQYDKRETGELIYGTAFFLEKKNGESWEPVPMIIENAAFTEEGYIIPPEGQSEIETNWEWLYGTLSPGTYRIEKTVIDHRDNGNKNYTFYAQFLLANAPDPEDPDGSGNSAAAGGSAAAGSSAETDFDVSDPKWNWIKWDADGDGVKEEISFEYNDLGDEAPSYIQVTLYKGNKELEGMIDRAYALKKIVVREDDDGEYLLVDYEMGDYYSHNAVGQCTIRLRDGKLEVASLTSGF